MFSSMPNNSKISFKLNYYPLINIIIDYMIKKIYVKIINFLFSLHRVLIFLLIVHIKSQKFNNVKSVIHMVLKSNNIFKM